MLTDEVARAEAAHDILEVAKYLTEAAQHLLRGLAMNSDGASAIGSLAAAEADIRCLHDNYPELFPGHQLEEVPHG